MALNPLKSRELTNKIEINRSASYEGCKTLISVFVLYSIFININKCFIDNITYFPIAAIIANTIWHFIPEKMTRFRKKGGKDTDAFGGKVRVYGMGANLSADSTLISIINAFNLSLDIEPRFKILGIVLTGICILYNGGTAGMLAFVASSLYYVAFVLNLRYVSLTIFLVFIIYFCINRKKLASFSGRLDVWKHDCIFFWKAFPKLTGMGHGSFRVLMSACFPKKIGDKQIFRFLWAHNDFLQFFIETGLTGIFSIILFIVMLFINSSHVENPFILAFIINAVCNFPMHMAPDSFLLIVFLKRFALNHF